jgi:DNA-binding NarL/FixJ family response regulator
MPRILIADDHPMVRRYLREVLEDETGCEVCGEATTGREAVVMTAALNPDIILLDISMPEINGLEAALEIHKKYPETEILVLTMHDPPEMARAALASGARACLLKSDFHNLIAAVHNISRDLRPPAL